MCLRRKRKEIELMENLTTNDKSLAKKLLNGKICDLKDMEVRSVLICFQKIADYFLEKSGQDMQSRPQLLEILETEGVEVHSLPFEDTNLGGALLVNVEVAGAKSNKVIMINKNFEPKDEEDKRKRCTLAKMFGHYIIRQIVAEEKEKISVYSYKSEAGYDPERGRDAANLFAACLLISVGNFEETYSTIVTSDNETMRTSQEEKVCQVLAAEFAIIPTKIKEWLGTFKKLWEQERGHTK